MSEKIYTLHQNGLIKGIDDRNIIHENGILHLSVQCWIMTQDEDILIQKRSSKKRQSAGKWDVSFGGHCSEVVNGNILISNLIKEGFEELGLSIASNDVIHLGSARYTSMNGKNKELLNVFLIYVDNKTEFCFNDGEVVSITWIKPEELDNFSDNSEDYANRKIAVSLLKNYLSFL